MGLGPDGGLGVSKMVRMDGNLVWARLLKFFTSLLGLSIRFKLLFLIFLVPGRLLQ